MIKGIIFDCFGVIYTDTLALLERKYIKGDQAKINKTKELRRLNDKGLINRDQFWFDMANVLAIAKSDLIEQVDSFDGADWELLDYIAELKTKYKTAVMSNVGHGFLERIFDTDRPREKYFDSLIASGDIGIVKPDPRAYVITADSLSLKPSECVFIDDKEHFTRGAEAVGMQTIVYTGFDKLKTELDELLKA